jgi:hypothetical protein
MLFTLGAVVHSCSFLSFTRHVLFFPPAGLLVFTVPFFERITPVREPAKAWLRQFYRYFDIAVSVGDLATAAAANCIVLGELVFPPPGVVDPTHRSL